MSNNICFFLLESNFALYELYTVKCFRADENSNGATNDDEVNAETLGENGNDSEEDDDGDADDDAFNVNYGVVTAIRALAVKGRGERADLDKCGIKSG